MEDTEGARAGPLASPARLTPSFSPGLSSYPSRVTAYRSVLCTRVRKPQPWDRSVCPPGLYSPRVKNSLYIFKMAEDITRIMSRDP